ncbi:MAG: TM2 domain-containing protein [Akkermansia sp.]|nr:TM2 domain-containing protein [Akkermansia sp.]
MKCEYCNNEIPQNMAKCPSCGAPAPYSAPAPTPYPAPAPYPGQAPAPYPGQMPPAGAPININVVNGAPGMQMATPPKSRIAYILLALFLGGVGAHNFYAARYGCAAAQLVLFIIGMCTCGATLVFTAPIVFIWCIIEMCVVNTDGRNVPMT